MESRVITKYFEVEGRKFCVKKYTAMVGANIAKLLMAKVIPVFQDFIPLIKELQSSKKPPIALAKGEDKQEKRQTQSESEVFDKIAENLSLDTIAKALEMVSEQDFEYIVTKSLQSISEVLPAGEAPVMYSNGAYGVEGIEYDVILVLRLTCEAVMWGCGDFFDGNRLASVMSPLFGGSK